MNKIIFLALLAATSTALAKGGSDETWANTSLSETTIRQIQEASFDYKRCLSDELQKPAYEKQDSRVATEAIVKQCESILAKMHSVYADAKVPNEVTERHLKQKRLQSTREVLQEMMMREAARSMEKQQK